MKKVKCISCLKDIYKNYDTFVLDQWGVMHDGIDGYPNAINCVKNLFNYDKNLIIISNSSKRKESTFNYLPELGFNKYHFTEVMTSGEMIWQSLVYENYPLTRNLGKNCFHIYNQIKEDGKEDGKKYLNGLEKFNFVENIEKANFILGCTPFANKEVLDFVPLLDKACKKNIPFICANPDYDTVESNSNNTKFCIGTLSELYKNMGGEVFILGKPSIEIYNKSTASIPNIKKSRILAIGDSLYHDIKGANNFGIDSLLITSTGIHSHYFDKINPIWESDNNTLQKLGIMPTFICSDLNF